MAVRAIFAAPAGRRSASSAAPLPANKLDAKRILCVASCKGGVGKSSVSVNLAIALAQSGQRVGILDLDIYGPSLPSLLPPLGEQKVTANGQSLINPLQWGAETLPLPLQFMSYGYLRPDEFAAIRGPMVAGIAQQLLVGVAWKALDVLVIDMPPGTGDVHLTLSQQVAVDAAVMVTTPQQLALVDVDKGIRMFDKVGIPTVAIVENMSFLDCKCGARHSVFGEGGGKSLAEKFGIDGFHQLPLDPVFNGQPAATEGPPLASSRFSDRPIAATLRHVAGQVTAELDKASAMRGKRLKAEAVNRGSSLLVKGGDLPEFSLPARTLRLACKCAHCIDEWTGEPKLDPKTVPMDIAAVKVESAGRYAVTVQWSDMHSSIYSFNHLRSMADSS